MSTNLDKLQVDSTYVSARSNLAKIKDTVRCQYEHIVALKEEVARLRAALEKRKQKSVFEQIFG